MKRLLIRASRRRFCEEASDIYQSLSALQVVTELVLGFPTHFATPQMLAKQQALFDILHNGLVALPINLPFTGTLLFQSLCQSNLPMQSQSCSCRRACIHIHDDF